MDLKNYKIINPHGFYFIRRGSAKEFKIQHFLKKKTVLGRCPPQKDEKDIICTRFVSRNHCVFTLKNGELYVECLNATNHTFVNGAKVAEKNASINS